MVTSSATAAALLFPINNFRRDALNSFNVYRRVKHHLIQATFEFGGPSQIFDLVMAFFDLDFG